MLDANLSEAQRFLRLPPEVRSARLEEMTDAESRMLEHDWAWWSRPNQQIPPGKWTTWLILAGRGYGKTRTGAETVRAWAQNHRYVNLIGATADDARDIMIEGESGILAVCPKSERPIYRPSKRQLLWPNGAKSLIFTADEPERLRGKQHGKLWCFIAGTPIATPCGDVPIESLRIGDEVQTRFGTRRVLAVGSRPADVGRVRFSDGRELIGTGEHPVLTCDGWTRSDQLRHGQTVFAGCFDRAVISAPTSASLVRTASARTSTSIDGFGSERTARFLRAITSTTATASRRTTLSVISNWFRSLLIRPTTWDGFALVFASSGPTWSPSPSSAQIAAATSSERSGSRRAIDALAVPCSDPRSSGRRHASAPIAGRHSARDSGLSALSVASIWEPAGSDEVFNLTVEGEREYLANGIVVHNCDELAAWRFPESWDQARLGLRLGREPQAVVTTTPKPTKLVKELIADPSTHVTRGTTYENRENLAPAFLSEIITKYEGTRLGRQELQAEVLDDNPNALWTRKDIDDNRHKGELPPLTRIVVPIDPAVTSNEDSDETGIVPVGRDKQSPPHFYVLGDLSLIASPAGWARTAIGAYYDLKADRVVGEVNNGGEMVESTLRNVDENVSYTEVRASRAKITRAEPVAALYEQGRVHHVGFFPQLEDQMCEWDPTVGGDSPDRMDSLVWGISELADLSGTGILAWAREQRARAEKRT